VALLPTGSELVAAGEIAGPGQIPNSNGPMLCGLVAQVGGQPEDLGIVRDDPTELRQLITRGLEADVLIMSGGVSTGDRDFVPRVLAELGIEQVFHGVRLKPGKPCWFGVASQRERRTLVFGLPGNPVSCLVCFELFVRPALGSLAGNWNNHLPRRELRLAEAFEHRSDRPTYYPARLRQDSGDPRVEPLAWQGSSDLRTLAEADALVSFPAGSRRYGPDDVLTVLMLDRP
jgi:molybdopterin molybdotransferase